MTNPRLDFIKNRFGIIPDDLEFDEETHKNIWVSSKEDPESISQLVFDKINNTYLIRENTFNLIIGGDPTKKKIYVQWILMTFIKLLKTNLSSAKQFIREDLSGVNNDLSIFDSLKKTKNFKEMSLVNPSIERIEDPSDINQYLNIEELYDAIYPFIPKDYSGLTKQLKLFTSLKESEILFEDKNFMVYTPFSRRANECLNPYAGWCTTRTGNTNYISYPSDNRRPDNSKSKLYVVIDVNTYNMFQLHFETDQIHNKNNSLDTKNFVSSFLKKSTGLDNFFYHELSNLIKMGYKSGNNKKYIKHALSFGYGKIIIETYDSNVTELKVCDFEIRGHCSLKRFTNLEIVVLSNNGLRELPDDLLNKNLKILSIDKNNFTELPESIKNLKKLLVLNLNNNMLTKLPSSIEQLDPKNGGSLVRMSIQNNKFDAAYLEKLRMYMPNVTIE